MPRDHVHRVGQPRDRRLRMILARFSRPADGDAATPNARKLRGSVFICEDLRPESQRLKKERYDDYRKPKSEGKNFPYFVLSKLPIRDRQPSNEETPLRPLLPPQPSPAVTRGPNTTTSTTKASTIPSGHHQRCIPSSARHAAASQPWSTINHDNDAALPRESSTNASPT